MNRVIIFTLGLFCWYCIPVFGLDRPSNWPEIERFGDELLTLESGDFRAACDRNRHLLSPYLAWYLSARLVTSNVSDPNSRFESDLKRLEIAKYVAERSGSHLATATVQLSIGRLHLLRGAYSDALSSYSTAEKLIAAGHKEIGFDISEMQHEAALGRANVWMRTNAPQAAIEILEGLLRDAYTSGEPKLQVRLLERLGTALVLANQNADAINAFERALNLARELPLGEQRFQKLNLSLMLAYTAVEEARAATSQRDDYLKRADSALEVAGQIAEDRWDYDGQVSVLMHKGLLEIERGRVADALKALSSASALCESKPKIDPTNRLRTYANLGNLLLEQRDNIGASNAYRKAAEVIETLRPRTREYGLRMSFFEQYAPVHLKLAQSLFRQGDVRGSFEASEKSKARTLLELFAGNDLITSGNIQRDQQRNLADKAALPSSETLAKALFPPECSRCVISYSLINDHILAIVLRSGGEPIIAKEWEIDRRALKGNVHRFRKNCESTDTFDRTLARDIYDTVVAPLRNEIEGVKHLVVIPDAELAALPFQVLLTPDDQYLLESLLVTYAPSVSALVQMCTTSLTKRAKPPAAEQGFLPMVAVSGPGSEAFAAQANGEVEDIAKLFHVEAYLGATKSTALDRLRRGRFVHLSCHGIISDESAVDSYLQFAAGENDDGKLYARDFDQFRLNAELVTLSACDTAIGQEVRGEGLLGLNWSLFRCGVPTTISSHWKVPGRSTREIMRRFYSALSVNSKGSSLAKADALRTAQLAVMRQFKTHPVTWGAFALYGAWE